MSVPLMLAFVLAFLVSWGLIRLLMPLFLAYALARPNARSSHKNPVPQGGGAGVIVGILLVGLPVASMAGLSPPAKEALAVAALLMGILGAWDDIRPLGWRFRLSAQALIIGGLLALLPEGLRIFPFLPLVVERGIALILGLWFVNLTNFMDGIDGLLVVGLAPMAATIGLGFFGLVPPEPVAMTFCGALLGFLMMNRPPARIFAGDLGSLSIGLIAAYLLFLVASRVSLLAAILLPLYFVGDATVTLLLRAWKRETLTVAHRRHAYQCAYDAGMPISRILGEVLGLNVVLAGLAAAALVWMPMAWGFLLLGVGLTGLLLWRQRHWKS
jgi:UDP-N-acetylmuramyl pentapeptide phosphotransferase/UDP-N-acetylglucosamine-1-phosphate transferase